MQKKQLFWILLALIICIPVARYIDTAPERAIKEAERLEAERLNKEKEEERNKRVETLRKQEEETRLQQEKEKKLRDLYEEKAQVLSNLNAIIDEFERFMVPDPFVVFNISGDSYDNIKISGTHRYLDGYTDKPITCEFYIKDVDFYTMLDGTVKVKCNSGELCIISRGKRTNEFSDFYLQRSQKVTTLIQSLYSESKAIKPKIAAIQQQIDAIY